ncbi:MAG: hypothetical protein LBC27_10430 [Spirochaetaceae bacterium]|jgi:hypothetical protein|nr:hypothetical protein [Spirochaetaceae bacterium]
MKQILFCAKISAASVLLFFSGTLTFALGEDILTFGGAEGWGQFKLRDGITELEQLAPYKALALNSAANDFDESVDMSVSFDEMNTFSDSTGHYILEVPETVYSAGTSKARFGGGAAVFSGALTATAYKNQADAGDVIIRARGNEALFSKGRNIGDFSIEFWLYPLSMENGEEPLNWTAAAIGGAYQIQNLSCSVSKNRMEWNFENFFFEPASLSNGNNTAARSVPVHLSSSTPVIPKRWSHHILRFESKTGLLEYLINGVLEDVRYTTASGSENGSVFLPLVGERGEFALGRRFNGMIDNVRVYSRFVENPEARRYPRGGWTQSDPIDLGAQNSSVIRIDAAGGAYNTLKGGIRNKKDAQDPFNFPGGAQMRFFIRASVSKYEWSDDQWRTFIPGNVISAVKGRYIELAVQFYPGGDFETTPYLEEISVVSVRESPPAPPSALRVLPKDGAVELSWKQSKDENAAGYLVYYGSASGNYLGDEASPAPSPIDVGKQNSISIDNLKNGVLYYFSISAYDKSGQIGDYSREVSARPLRMIE